MPFRYQIDRTLKIIYYFGYGQCSNADFIRAEQLASTHPLWCAGLAVICDLTAVRRLETGANAFFSAIKVHLAQNHREGGMVPLAVITHAGFSQEPETEDALQAEGHASPVQARIFSNLFDGAHYLGIEDRLRQVLQMQLVLKAANMAEMPVSRQPVSPRFNAHPAQESAEPRVDFIRQERVPAVPMTKLT